jgi:hypothetical protein
MARFDGSAAATGPTGGNGGGPVAITLAMPVAMTAVGRMIAITTPRGRISDGSVWKVRYEYEHLYAYNPEVMICPSEGILILLDEGKKLNVERIK